MRNKPGRPLSRRRATHAPSSRRALTHTAANRSGQLIQDISRGLIQDFHIGVIVLDANSRIEFANRAALKMFGFTKSQVLGKTGEDLGLEEFSEDGTKLPRALRARVRAIESGKPVRGAVVGIRRPGVKDMLWLYGNVVPQFTSEGTLKRLIVTMSDVTDRMKARQDLERTNEFNRQILTSVQEGIIVHGPDLRYQLWNPYMERMSGVKAQDVIGKHPRDLFPFLEEHGGLAAMEKALTGEVVTEIDMPYEVSQTGERGWCDNKYAPLRSESGEIVGVIATVRDVTGRKRHEDELHELSSRLLQLQDQERRRIARDLHDGLAQHLMAASLNLTQLSKSRRADRTKRAAMLSETRKIIAECAKQTRSLSYLLHPPLLDELGLASAIEEYAAGFGRRTGIRLDLELEPNIGRLSRETETALFRILQESLGNIQKHSGSLSGSIRMERKNGCICLQIRDAGKGISSHDLSAGVVATRRLGVGILGMRERMRQLGGWMEISSEGHGTTVRAVLPLKSGADDGRSHSHSG